SHGRFVTLEDHAVAGGAGSAVNEALEAHGIVMPVLNLGLPDVFLEHGSREECLKMAGLDAEGIRKSIGTWLAGAESKPRKKAGAK
ncbi:MAG TPA: transketolase C-terminal domain-containing protein, partial [Gammaproteobacteria bacterium]|nr:transketolase C-terminal domain-containing protein [Gammaproteobacteria bacterium]